MTRTSRGGNNKGKALVITRALKKLNQKNGAALTATSDYLAPCPAFHVSNADSFDVVAITELALLDADYESDASIPENLSRLRQVDATTKDRLCQRLVQTGWNYNQDRLTVACVESKLYVLDGQHRLSALRELNKKSASTKEEWKLKNVFQFSPEMAIMVPIHKVEVASLQECLAIQVALNDRPTATFTNDFVFLTHLHALVPPTSLVLSELGAQIFGLASKRASNWKDDILLGAAKSPNLDFVKKFSQLSDIAKTERAREAARLYLMDLGSWFFTSVYDPHNHRSKMAWSTMRTFFKNLQSIYGVLRGLELYPKRVQGLPGGVATDEEAISWQLVREIGQYAFAKEALSDLSGVAEKIKTLWHLSPGDIVCEIFGLHRSDGPNSMGVRTIEPTDFGKKKRKTGSSAIGAGKHDKRAKSSPGDKSSGTESEPDPPTSSRAQISHPVSTRRAPSNKRRVANPTPGVFDRLVSLTVMPHPHGSLESDQFATQESSPAVEPVESPLDLRLVLVDIFQNALAEGHSVCSFTIPRSLAVQIHHYLSKPEFPTVTT